MSEIVVAVVGRSGQLARALARCPAAQGVSLVCLGRPEIDITKSGSIARAIEDVHPHVVVNAAAYTSVDKAESERDAAFEVNAYGPALLAETCSELDVPLIHVSTDYVFDGSKRTPYTEEDVMTPLGVYGASKAAGEVAIRVSHAKHVILRTSWLYGPDGHNFVRTMLRLARSRDEISVVDDQIGSPTSTDDLAAAILGMAPSILSRRTEVAWGTYHLSGGGQTSWHGFAEEIFRLSALAGNRTPHLRRISAAEYPAAARRPKYSVLDNAKIERAFAVTCRPWRSALVDCMRALEPNYEMSMSA